MRTESILSANLERYREACEVIPGGVNTSLRRFAPTLVFKHASGAVLVDEDGKEYID
jgi:glutamate-1-semialdehyde aminotransferase